MKKILLKYSLLVLLFFLAMWQMSVKNSFAACYMESCSIVCDGTDFYGKPTDCHEECHDVQVSCPPNGYSNDCSPDVCGCSGDYQCCGYDSGSSACVKLVTASPAPSASTITPSPSPVVVPPPPPPGGASCGDGSCNNGETCSTCGDCSCSSTPPPPPSSSSTLTIDLIPNPANGVAPYTVTFRGAIIKASNLSSAYYFYLDCTNDGRHDNWQYLSGPQNLSVYEYSAQCTYNVAGAYVARLETYRFNGLNVAAYATDTAAVTVTNSGVIQSRAVVVDDVQNTCSYVNSSTDYLDGTIIGFTNGPNPLPQSQPQGGSSYITWNALAPGTYSLFSVPQNNLSLSRSCWVLSPSGTSGEGLTAPVANGQTLTFNIGYNSLSSWFQVVGGHLRVQGSGGVGGSVSIEVPNGQSLIKEEANQNSPIVSYENSLDIGSLGGSISRDGYAVKDVSSGLPNGFSYYNYYFNRFDTKTSLTSGVNNPASGVYTATDLITSGVWQINTGESVIIFVSGNLNITSNIRVANGGFLAFIVKGNITIDDTVGYATPLANPDKYTQPNVTGIYITEGSLTTESNAFGADLQAVLAGTFVASNFSLQRDLDAGNVTYPGEMFVFRPDLWIYAPQELREISLTWTEIAP